MLLKKFRVTNFRSINDSGTIEVARITALLGRNESGKSNLLRALQTLNPAEGFAALNPIKDFPRHRRLADCSDETAVVETAWELESVEQDELASIWPRARGVRMVRIGRRYGAKSRWVGIDVPASNFNIAEIKGVVRQIIAVVKAKAVELPDGQKATLQTAAEKFGDAICAEQNENAWAKSASKLLSDLRVALATANVELNNTQEAYIHSLEERADAIPKDEEAHQLARAWVVLRS